MKRAAITIASLNLAWGLLACAPSGVDGFPDQRSKELAWEAYNCTNYGRQSAQAVATKLNLEILSDEIPSDELGEARRWANKLQGPRVDTVDDVMEYASGPDYTNVCSGWLWERRKSQPEYWSGFDDFDFDAAREAGVVAQK